MRDLFILLVHLIATLARLMGPGGARSVIAESLLVKQQLLILSRSRQRAPNLRASDRILAGVCALFMRSARVIRSAIVLKPSTILDFHRMLRNRKYRLLFSPKRRGRTGPKGPSTELVEAIVEMKRRNPVWGCPRIAQQIGLIFDIQIDKDVVRRVLATHYRPEPDSRGPSWLTFLGLLVGGRSASRDCHPEAEEHGFSGTSDARHPDSVANDSGSTDRTSSDFTNSYEFARHRLILI